MNKKLQVSKYVVSDFLSAAIAWALFFFFRKYYIEYQKYGELPFNIISTKFYLGITLIPACWLVLYFISILDDEIKVYNNYYQSFFALLALHFLFTGTFRFILSSITNRRIKRREIGFNTIIIGSNENALKLFDEINGLKKGSGNLFVGFVHVDEKNGFSEQLKIKLPHLGEFKDIREISLKYHVEEIIIAIESWEHEYLSKIINDLSDIGVVIKIIPDMYDILSGSVKMTSIFGALLIEINRKIMPQWQQSMKRLMDVCISVFVMICFSWLYIIIAVAVKM